MITTNNRDVRLGVTQEEFKKLFLEHTYDKLEEMFYPISRYKLKQLADELGLVKKKGRPVTEFTLDKE